jgi:hypothetical protein
LRVLTTRLVLMDDLYAIVTLIESKPSHNPYGVLTLALFFYV